MTKFFRHPVLFLVSSIKPYNIRATLIVTDYDEIVTDIAAITKLNICTKTFSATILTFFNVIVTFL